MDNDGLYRPLRGLRTTRLIQLLPGDREDAISIKLLEVELDDVRDTYEALSYCWGDPYITERIRCGNGNVEVTSNAAAFLRQLRKPQQERLLWMDTISINQSNREERTSQVKIMHIIYQFAASVQAWLGPEGADSDLAMSHALSLDSSNLIQDRKSVV